MVCTDAFLCLLPRWAFPQAAASLLFAFWVTRHKDLKQSAGLPPSGVLFLGRPFSKASSMLRSMATILVIDDQEPIRVLLRTALEEAGHEVLEASNGRLGLALYRARSADLVITDYCHA